MKVAVFYTGCLRTFDRTISYNMKNLLIQSDPNVEIHVFACVQNDRLEPNSLMTQNLTKMFELPSGKTVLRSVEWFYRNDPHIKLWMESQLENLRFSTADFWKDYLKTSGSMVEYVQLYRCWRQMIQHEEYDKTTYDYVVRLRTDVVVATPLDFSKLPETDKTMDGVLNWLSPGRKQNGHFEEYTEVTPEKKDETPDLDLWILTVRKNVFYVMPRKTAEIVSSLGYLYASIQPKLEQYNSYTVWYDAESQLQLICIQNGITIFNSTTHLESQSLYEFKRHVYFDYNETEEYLKYSDQYAAFIYRPYNQQLAFR